jgi:twitching motility protein PilT
VLAYELLLATLGMRNLIRESKLSQVETTIQISAKEGMVLMDNSLSDLYNRCLITYDTALSRARHPETFSKIDAQPNAGP